MGFPYFNPPYLQKVDKIEEGNYFVPSGGVEPDSVRDIRTREEKVIKLVKWITLAVAVAVVVAMGILIPEGRLF